MHIKEVEELLNVPSATIRYWEKMGIAGHIKRDASGYREYSPEVVEWLQLVKCFREIGIPIEQIQNYSRLKHNANGERYAILTKQRQILEAKIKEYQSSLKLLNKKIENYQDFSELNMPTEREKKQY